MSSFVEHNLIRASEVEILSEKEFAAALTMERRRSERTRNVFLLALLELRGAGDDDAELAGAVLPAVLSVVRDTDVVGWYLQNAVLGVIFTNWNPETKEIGKSIVTEKLQKELSARLSPSCQNKLQITYYFFPEVEGDGPADIRVLYPSKTLPHASNAARMVKRSLDILTSLFLLPFLMPLFLVIALAIKLNSKGPVLFRQTRVGQLGKTFTLLKFRSMYENSDSSIHQEYVAKLIAGDDIAGSDGESKRVFKLVSDPRVTRIGRLLRKSSLDELPQFLNVLSGEMSLIGPRPPLPYEFERYEPWHRRRVMEVKPGITGLWQVNGRSRTTFDEMVRLDLRYARNWSIWLDVKIILRTPGAIFSGDGAY